MGLSTLDPRIQPERELAPNKTKQIQIKARKKAWISLDSFGRIEAFQWVTGEKIKKNSPALNSRGRLWAKARNPNFPVLFLSPRGLLRERGGQTPRLKKI
jgi:hypothetical protein